MRFIEQIKSKITKKCIIKLLFYSIMVFLVILVVNEHSPPNAPKKTLKYQGKSHIREPTNLDKQLIIEEKKHFIVNLTKSKTVHYKEQHHRTIKVIATAYVPLCEEGCTGITETGIDVKNNTTYHGMKIIATDPSVIPLHSIVKVKTKHKSFMAIAEDTGGGINGFAVDVLMSTKEKAINFGREYATITILREGES